MAQAAKVTAYKDFLATLSMSKTVLTIAGSDASSAAGIQADLRTLHNLGTHAATVITAVTAQSNNKRFACQTVNDDLFQQQLLAVLEQFDIAAVKTGMLASASQVRLIAECLPTSLPLIIDPVWQTSSGHLLINEETLAAMDHLLFPRAYLLTPNIPELQWVCKSQTQSSMECITRLLKTGCKGVLVKGGHAQKAELTDHLYTFNEQQKVLTHPFTHPRKTGQYRGTGCVLSAAICAFISKQETTNPMSLTTAVQMGIDYLQNCIQQTPITENHQAAILQHSNSQAK